ncbi:EAL domain-containing protein [Aquibium carbonis]|uniref:EAL domain-containing protein n=1 Tax=Aquibium carbonis TaxID=2495581 RepID=A0A3R9ZW18_9HYPH|nr:EAL domain-containing protein [Aquibium carbonis]RST79472.1 EAL domain-containing protein [Aquibium carbonis]
MKANAFAEEASTSLVDLQSDIIDKIAFGETLTAVAETLCREAEKIVPEAICSILRITPDGRLLTLAAPSLPQHYSSAIDGVSIGPAAGSCGTAAFFGAAIEATDIETDPRWTEYKALALPIGLRACWSSPIRARDGRVVGTFALYFRTPRGPGDVEREVVSHCTHLCAIAFEHDETVRRMQEMAYVDLLSGLPNRASFLDRVASLTRTGDQPFSLILIDLDHLKDVNDTLGHAGGDALIRAVADRLRSVDPSFEPHRLGGDEFAILLPGQGDEAAMADAANRLIEAVRHPLTFNGETITPFVTAGGAIFEGPRQSAETLCQNADFALYHGKAESRGSFVPYRQDMRSAMTQRVQAIREIEDALADRRILAYYQPIVRIDTGEIVGLEALARIRMPDGRVVAAGPFQKAMTDARIARTLTDHMLATVSADIREWLSLGIPFQHVGVNVTSADFSQGDLESRIYAAFAAADVPLRHVILEINETVYMGGQDKRVARAAEGLRSKGMRVALDDFGTGHASLTHLRDFPVDIIKIDKSFVERIVDDRPSLAIVQALVEVARKLDIRVVAEGIETLQQNETLLSLGCVLGQGFLYSRAVSAAVATGLLQQHAQRNGDAVAVLPLRARA